jgi:hypothetical protein
MADETCAGCTHWRPIDVPGRGACQANRGQITKGFETCPLFTAPGCTRGELSRRILSVPCPVHGRHDGRPQRNDLPPGAR